jgi:hypothetical protein
MQQHVAGQMASRSAVTGDEQNAHRERGHFQKRKWIANT